MESFGEKLKSTRENLNYSIEQIARDTNIAKRYLTGLEEEDFSVFPGETYLRGFLRNYAEYLGLDAEELISIYHNMKIQEQPLPMDQLIEHKRTSPKPFLIASGIIAAVAAIVLLLIFLNPFEPGTATVKNETDDIQKEVVFTGQQIDNLVTFRGFIIKVPSGSTQYDIIIQKIDTGLTATIGNDSLDIYIGQEKELDLNKDEIPDLVFTLEDIFTEQNQKKARIDLKPAIASGMTTTAKGEEYSLTAQEKSLIADGTATVVLENTSPQSFTVELSALQDFYCIYIQDNKPRQEKYFTKGETLSIPVEKTADVRFSDAGAVQATVNGNGLEIGSKGKIKAKIIKWVKDGETFQLVAFPNK